MKTKFDNIEVSIDDEIYVVNFTYANPKQKEQFDALSKEDEEISEAYAKIFNELNLLESKKTNNTDLIPHLEGKEKVEVLREQREVISKIEKLTPKFEKLAKHEYSKELSEQKYELLVSGVDKDRLKEDAKKHFIPMSIVMNEILLGVIKAKEKK
jgi:hypothetical protein